MNTSLDAVADRVRVKIFLNYRGVVDRSASGRVREVFARLLEANQKDMHNLARDSGHLHDW